MSDHKSDTKIEPEIVTATLVVAEADPETENVASTSIEDPEAMTPKSSSEKLKDVDKKTFLFAGYVFWAMIFVSGGATAAVLLSRKKPAPTPAPSPAPSPAPTFSESPTVALVPSAAPSGAPVYPRCSHDDIKEKLLSVFGTDNCDEVEDLDLEYGKIDCEEEIESVSNSFTATAIYEFSPQGGSFAIPDTFTGTFSDTVGVDVKIDELPRDGDPCTFHEADEFFQRLSPCSVGEIKDKLYLYFDKDSCTTDDFNDGYMTECELTTGQSKASFNYTYSTEKPKTLEISYFKKDQDSFIWGGNFLPPDVVDLDLSGEVCPFDEATSSIFERLAQECQSYHNGIMAWMKDAFGEGVCKNSKQNGNPAYTCTMYTSKYGMISSKWTSYSQQSDAIYEYRSTGDFFVPVGFRGTVEENSLVTVPYTIYDSGNIDFSKLGNSCDDYYPNGRDKYFKALEVLANIEAANLDNEFWTP